MCSSDLDSEHLTKLSHLMQKGLLSTPGVALLGDGEHRFAGCFNLKFSGVSAETLLAVLPDFALSVGSACNSAQAIPSHVLLAMGLSRDEADQCVRVSLGRYSTEQEVNLFVSKVISAYHTLNR